MTTVNSNLSVQSTTATLQAVIQPLLLGAIVLAVAAPIAAAAGTAVASKVFGNKEKVY